MSCKDSELRMRRRTLAFSLCIHLMWEMYVQSLQLTQFGAHPSFHSVEKSSACCSTRTKNIATFPGVEGGEGGCAQEPTNSDQHFS